MLMSQVPVTDRPRERLAQRGAEALGDGELLALLLSTGARGMGAHEVAAALLRRFGLYSAMTNNLFQHFVIMSLTTLLALLLVRDESGWMRSLGIFWLGLLFLNLISILFLRFLHEP